MIGQSEGSRLCCFSTGDMFQLLNKMELCFQVEGLIFLDSIRCHTGVFISRFLHYIHRYFYLNEQR